MESKFVPPKNKEEFIKQVEPITYGGAMGVLNSLRHRRASMVRGIDIEIHFYEKVVEYLKNGDVEWPGENANNG